MDEMEVKEYLRQNDETFRQLAEQHQAYERELEQFQHKPYLNPEEQLKETELKKRKLVLKDRMQFLIHQHRTEQPAG